MEREATLRIQQKKREIVYQKIIEKELRPQNLKDDITNLKQEIIYKIKSRKSTVNKNSSKNSKAENMNMILTQNGFEDPV